MKSYPTYIIPILFVILISCSSPTDRNTIRETYTTDVYITEVFKAKYTKIEGYIFFRGIKLEIDNGNEGYYYKDYNIRPGNIIKRTVTVYLEEKYNNNPYKHDILISTDHVNFDDFELK